MAKFITSIDPGDHTVKIVVVKDNGRGAYPEIVTAIKQESHGFRKGNIVDPDDARESVRRAIARAEKIIGQRIRRVHLVVDGAGLSSQIVDASTVVSRGDSEVADYDVRHLFEAAELKVQDLANRTIIDTLPIGYKLDGKKVIGHPEKMHGAKLEGRILFVTCLTRQLNDLVEACDRAGVSIISTIPSPIAGSIVSLSKEQKYAGCALVDIGAETTKIAVYEDGMLHSIQTFDIGSQDVTNDIALGLKIDIAEAESIKRELGSQIATQKRLIEIIEARLSDIFELINDHLKKLGRSELLPAGVTIVGGGAFITRIDAFASRALSLSARLASPLYPQYLRSHAEGTRDLERLYLKDPIFAASYGLAILGLEGADDHVLKNLRARGKPVFGGLARVLKLFLP